MVTTRKSKKSNDKKSNSGRTTAAGATGSGRSSVSSASSSEQEEPDPINGDSDDLEPEDEEGIKPPRAKAEAPAKTKVRSRLDENIERVLLQEIEAQPGGLYYLTENDPQALSKLLKNPERSHLYGKKRGDPIRKKISKRIHRLKNVLKADYDALLREYSISPAQLSQKQVKDLHARHSKLGVQPTSLHLPSSTEYVSESDTSDIEDCYGSESESEPTQAPTAREPVFSPTKKPNKPDLISSKVQSPAAKKIQTTSKAQRDPSKGSRKDTKPKQEARKDTKPEQKVLKETKMTSEDPWEDSKRLKVYIDEPWRNSEDVFVTRFFGYKHRGNKYDGIDIRITGDPRDISEDRFALEANESKPTESFTLTKPAIPATHWLDRDEYAQFHMKDPQGECFEDGVKQRLRAYKKLPDDKKKRKYDLMLIGRAGEEMQFTDKAFVPQNEEYDDKKVFAHHQIADFDTGQTHYDDDVGEDFNVEGTAAVISWKLINESTERDIDDDVDNGKKGKNALQEARNQKMKEKAARRGGNKVADVPKTSPTANRRGKKKGSKGPAQPSPDGIKSMDVEVDDQLESQMMENINRTNPPENEDGVKEEVLGSISTENWNKVKHIVHAESRRSGRTMEDVVREIWVWASSIQGDDRTVEQLVCDFLEDAAKKMTQWDLDAQTAELERGIAENGGSKKTGTLVSPEELEAQRKALFKPTVQKKSADAREREGKERENQKRLKKQNELRDKASE